ncbi:AAA family ATPase [Catenibacterium faecis]|uniref:AAA family ATPase n=1 Tax=Catenibacterium faecis TaxID=2764323 RepID=UPI001EEEED4C|nr:AAA family ATPase [Catenibacterium faecis]
MIERPLYLDKIMPFVDTPFVKILTGVRRCGKSIILKMIIKKIKKEKNVDDEQILNYRFDSMEYEDMNTKELYLEIKSKILQSKKAI